MPPSSKPPVRLKVSYKTATGLISEFTRSVGKGTVALESRRALEIGTRFVFELRAADSPAPVEVQGEVFRVTSSEAGKFLIHVRYEAPKDLTGVDALIQSIFDAHKHEKLRKHPRVPINLQATEEAAYSPSFLVKDLSKGGLGVEVESPEVPHQARMGAPFLLELTLSVGTLVLHGEVVWTFAPPPDRARWINPGFGVTFGKLRPDTQGHLERILLLRGLPPPPWKTRISFGSNAVSRMP